MQVIDYNETETRELITEALKKAGWKLHENMRYEYPITDGRININESGESYRENGLFADYMLMAPNGSPLAIVEAKRAGAVDGTGIQQAIDYAQKLNVSFGFSSNGNSFISYNLEKAEQITLPMDGFPTQSELWKRFCDNKKYTPEQIEIISQPHYHSSDGRTPRYYQQIVIDKVVEAYARGDKRMMFVMATGTGKTYTAFQILYRLLEGSKNSNLRILYLADRNVLIDQTMDQDFKPFGNKMVKIEERTASQSHEVFMSLYQQLVAYNLPEGAPQPYEQFKPDFFDIIFIDECHRGSAKANSEWRKILEYFKSAVHVGMTATPKDDGDPDNSNMIYFGDPLYTYSLKQGIDDGFLAPYRVTQVSINVDHEGYQVNKNEAELSCGTLNTDQRLYREDLARKFGLIPHYEIAAQRITSFLEEIGPMTKTIVFCDEETDADHMRTALIKYNQKRQLSNGNHYIMRITSSDTYGKKHLKEFLSKNSATPTVVTTSQLLSTGVDTKSVGLIVFYRNVSSMTEFKQIIGRGTRIVENINITYFDEDGEEVKEQDSKLYFDILDFRNVTNMFFDPAFDGEPLGGGQKKGGAKKKKKYDGPKFHKPIFDGNGSEIFIDHETKMVLDKDGKPITTSYIDYSKQKISEIFSTLDEFLETWNRAERKKIVVDLLEKQGVDMEELERHYPTEFANRDIFDIICNIAFNQPMLLRTERAKRISDRKFLEQYSDEARRVLEILLMTYSEQGILAFENNDALKVNELALIGTPKFIRDTLFGGKEKFKSIITDMESILYQSLA